MGDVIMLFVACACCIYERLTGREVYSCRDLRVLINDDDR